MSKLRVLITDSSATYRSMFSKAVTELNCDADVVCVADGAKAHEEIRRRDYEIIVIDAEVAELSSLLNEIAVQLPKAFVLVAARPSLTTQDLCSEAMMNGAADCLTKPINSSYNDNYDVIKSKIADIIRSIDAKFGMKTDCNEPEQPQPKKAIIKSRFKPGIVLIAASTGGPLALEKILPKLSAGFPVPILVVQHMLMQFTETLAYNLDQKTRLNVKVAENGDSLKAGIIYIAPGGAHMKLGADARIILEDSPAINGVKPAADVLFESVADTYNGSGVLAVILTGMGHDGERGLALLKDKQECFCLTQSEETCVVYGMPRAAVESGNADKVVDLDRIAHELESFNYDKSFGG